MSKSGKTHIETLAVHAGHEPDPATGAVTPPIHLSTTFQRDIDGAYPRGFMYGRYDNPNRHMLEACLAELDRAEACAAFGSGQAATSAVLQALKPGDHVVAPLDVYFGTAKLLKEVLAPWGLQVSFTDLTDLDALKAAMRPNTRLIWAETPSNPLLKITDIAAVAEIAHAAGARLACDHTWATPVLSDVLGLGADIAVHATTKYLGGHSDVLGGAVSLKRADEFHERIRLIQGSMGGVPGPFDCWLLMRGIKTLALRVRAQSANAASIAEFLAGHPMVEAVHYPGLPDHPGHEIARRQMSMFGAMLSVQVKGGQAEAMAAVARSRLFTRATSLGGVESLIEHRKSNEAPDSATPDNLLRVSVGIEHADDLIADLDQALRG
ncbi:MAG: aminotransferase class V-fold PLP-dependent enzyme [Proteobacteria bacterium]|nr:aminotransferase class V-fold PLP-dependent enzyme [Pseudomonadota bacterium]